MVPPVACKQPLVWGHNVLARGTEELHSGLIPFLYNNPVCHMLSLTQPQPRNFTTSSVVLWVRAAAPSGAVALGLILLVVYACSERFYKVIEMYTR